MRDALFPAPVAAPNIDAVVFDFDGVIVRSIEVHALAYQLVLRPFGVVPTAREVFMMEGARSESIIRDFLARSGEAPSDERVKRLSTLKQRTFERVGAPQVYDAADRLVRQVAQRGFARAIATGTRRKNIPGIAPALVPFFEHIVSQESYTHDKPHPEPYLTASELLQVEASRCLVVENAPRGIESAKRAGMYVVAITSTLPRRELTRADVVVDELDDVLDILPERPGGVVRAP